MPQAMELIDRYGDDQKALGIVAAHAIENRFSGLKSIDAIPEAERPAVRNDLNRVVAELRTVTEAPPRLSRG